MSGDHPMPDRRVIVTTLGLTQIMAWGSSYYLPAVIAPAVSARTGWPFPWIIGSLSLGLLVAGLISPRVGAAIIALGMLPLALFGAPGYAKLMGRLAMPSLIAQAAAPSLGALLLGHAGASGLLSALLGLALVNVVSVAALLAVQRSSLRPVRAIAPS